MPNRIENYFTAEDILRFKEENDFTPIVEAESLRFLEVMLQQHEDEKKMPGQEPFSKVAYLQDVKEYIAFFSKSIEQGFSTGWASGYAHNLWIDFQTERLLSEAYDEAESWIKKKPKKT